jgi:hypothetical protein
MPFNWKQLKWRIDRARVTPRIRRLCVCALARMCQEYPVPREALALIEASELYADGDHSAMPPCRLSARERRRADRIPMPPSLELWGYAANECLRDDQSEALRKTAWMAAEVICGIDHEGQSDEAYSSELESRAYVAIWRRLNCLLAPRHSREYPRHVQTLAEQVYALRDQGAIPPLSDALEECGDLRGAYHLRRGIHRRGCFAVDQILGMHLRPHPANTTRRRQAPAGQQI